MDIRLQVLETITDNFSDKKKVGSGGYGDVYKGVHNGKEIAVKKLRPLLGIDDKDYKNEFRNLSKVHHENIVQLIGYCYESWNNFIEYNGELNMATIKERILCFDYMQGGSLDSHIKESRGCARTNDSLHSDNSEDLIGQTRSGCSTVLSFDPSQELRFLFEPRMNASTCLQLTNMTEGFIAFNIKTNKWKYCAQPNTGVMPPCSKCYISTLKAQEEAPFNMQCHDMFLVQSARVNEDLTSDEITNAFLEEGNVDMMKMPIVYVAADQFPSSNV